jgi:hypothetical protein
MTPLQFVGLGLRLAAIWLCCVGFHYLFPAVFGQHTEEQTLMRYSGIGVGGLYFVVALTIWLYPLTIARWLLPKSNAERTISVRIVEVAHIALVLLGLWILANSMPTLVWYIFRTIIVARTYNGPGIWDLEPDVKADIASSIVSIAIALTLVLKSAVIAKHFCPTGQNSGTDGL